jgi:hypothetical protein
VKHRLLTWLRLWPGFLLSPWRWRYVCELVRRFGGWRGDRLRFAIEFSLWAKVANPGLGPITCARVDHRAFMGLAQAEVALQRAIESIHLLGECEP